METAAAVALASQALVLLGEDPIAAFEETGTPGIVADSRYETTVRALLAGHPWHFARTFATLTRLTAEPETATGYTAAYQRPIDCLRVVCPWLNERAVTDWSLDATRILLDAGTSDTVELEYLARTDESRWSPVFTQALVYQLAAEFAVPVTGDPKLAGYWAAEAAKQLARARHANATERPTRPVQPGSLLWARSA